MTLAHSSLDQLGTGLSERSLLAFMRNLPPESATLRGVLDEDGGWSRVEMLLARTCEAVEHLIWVTVCKGLPRGKWPPRPAPIERPGVKDEGKRHLGSGAIPVSEFDEWWGGDAGG